MISSRGSQTYNNGYYQVDFTKKSSGKQISKTKRQICWKFGIVNEEAVESGCRGSDCRGEEHEILFIWSITSGKRNIILDGETVHFSVRPRDKKFDYSWTMKGHVMKIAAYAVSSLRAKPCRRQFDLVMNGISFFDFPKIFQLGTVSDFTGIIPKANGKAESYANNNQFDSQSSQGQIRYEKQDDLLDLSLDPSPMSVASPFFATNADKYEAESTFNVNHTQFDNTLDSTPVNVTSKEFTNEDNVDISKHSNHLKVANELNPALEKPTSDNYYTQSYGKEQNDLNKLAEDITIAPYRGVESFGFADAGDNHQIITAGKPYTTNSFVDHPKKSKTVDSFGTPSLEESSTLCSSIPDEHESSEKQVKEVDVAFKKLVNLDDIFNIPEFDQKRGFDKKPTGKNLKTTSKGLPPVKHDWCGYQPSLSEIQSTKHTSTIMDESVMQMQSSHLKTGEMVLHETKPGNQWSLPSFTACPGSTYREYSHNQY